MIDMWKYFIMHKSVSNLIVIKDTLKKKKNKDDLTNIIAVSKNFAMSDITPLLDYGHVDFGENKVQEALEKWKNIKKLSNNVRLHMIGKLQTNKVKYVIPLFDYIHSLDNLKLAEKISNEQKKKNKFLKIFIQVNVGNESQKSGINIDQVESFYKKCVEDLNLNIIGLMCIPPVEGNVKSHFLKIQSLNVLLGFKDLSMGMSSDYLEAINYGSTFIRIGSKIFGQRN
jgi:PLP dependent protein